jgi:hypothetical protein
VNSQLIKEIVIVKTRATFGLAKVRSEGWTYLQYGDMSGYYCPDRCILFIEHAGIDSLADLKSLIDGLYEQHNPIPKKKKRKKK